MKSIKKYPMGDVTKNLGLLYGCLHIERNPEDDVAALTRGEIVAIENYRLTPVSDSVEVMAEADNQGQLHYLEMAADGYLSVSISLRNGWQLMNNS